MRLRFCVYFLLAIFSHAAFAASSLDVSPASGYQGATLNLTISGSGFVQDQMQVAFSDTRVLVNGVRVVSSSSLVANVTLLAVPGPQTISIITGGTTATASFEILPSPLSNAESAMVSYFAGYQTFVGSRDGQSVNARLFEPRGIASDGTSLYVTDNVMGTIRKIAIATGDVSTFTGSPMQNTHVDGVGSTGGFGSPPVTWSDGANLYTIDGCSIRRISLATREITPFAGTFGKCANPNIVDGPRGVAQLRVSMEFMGGDSQSLYVLDGPACPLPNTPSSCIGVPLLPGYIRPISLATGETSSIQWPPGPSVGFLRSLWSLDGYLYTFWDSVEGKLTIGRLNLATRQHEFLFNSRDNSNGRTFIPVGPWYDGNGNFYFLENLTVRRLVLATGALSSIATLPAAAALNNPSSVWGVGDNLYITDAKASIVSRVNIPAGTVSLVAGQYSPPPPPVPSEGVISRDRLPVSGDWNDGEFIYGYSGNAIYKVRIADGETTHIAGAVDISGRTDGTGTAARFPLIRSLWGDGTYLYVLQEGYDAVRRVNLATREVTTFASIPPVSGDQVPFLRDIWGDVRYLYVTDGLGRIYRVSIATREATIFAGNGFKNGPPYYRDGIGTAARFQNLTAIWGDGSNLYVRDACTIRRVDKATAAVTTFAGNIDECEQRDGPLADARYNTISDIWGNGSLMMVADLRTIRTIDLISGEVKTIAGNVAVVGTENGSAFDARFLPPTQLTSDGVNLYVVDIPIRKISFAAAVQKYSIGTSGGAYWTASAPGPISIGYGRMMPAPGDAAADGVAIYSFRSNGTLVSEAAVPASSLVQEGRIYAQIDATTRTGIALANPNDQEALISFTYTDAEGLSASTRTIVIPANNQIAAFLDEAPFAVTPNARTFTFTSSVPVGAVALRGFVNERSEFLMTTLPVAPISSSSTEAIVLPHFADGGGWRTQLLLVNPTAEPISGTVEIGGTYSYSIAPRSSARIVTPGTDTAIRVGSVRVLPAAGSKAPVASTVFSFVERGVTVTESGAASTGIASSFRVFAEYSSGMQTGVGIANTGAAAATVQFQLFDLAGQSTGRVGSLTLPANGHRSLFLGEIPGFQNLPASFRGVLRVTSNNAISVLGLRGRYNERGDFLVSTTPAVAENAATTTSELIFPHIVSGGGYTTEFLLMSRGAGSEGTVSLRSQDGSEMPLPLN